MNFISSSALLYLSIFTLIIYALNALDMYFGNRSIVSLKDINPHLPKDPPRVSIIVAARNEEKNIREGLTSLLAQDYHDFELIVVDDRSDDRTPGILADMMASDARIKLVRINELPAGWLGKNHAHWTGVGQATGSYILFTDADIVMAPSLLSRAVAYMLAGGIDHLAVTPRMNMPGLALDIFGASFIFFFAQYARPWKAKDPRSYWHIGIGAFNLVRESAYRSVGGHARIPLRPDDDMKLGKIVKLGGFRQDVAFGAGLMDVEWYATVGECVRGLEKNAFAGVEYSIPAAVGGSLFHLAFTVWPFAAMFIAAGPTRLVYAAAVAVISLTFIDCARIHGSRWWYAVGFPLATVLFVYIILRTMALNVYHGGITWRGTFYRLAELRGNRV